MIHNYPVTFTAIDGTKFCGVGNAGRRRAFRQLRAHNRSLRRYAVWHSTLTGWQKF